MHTTNEAANLAKLPAICAVFLATNAPGKRIGFIKRGESGYYVTDYDTPDASAALAQEFVAQYNACLHVTEAQQLAMRIGSAFGWHVPGANPDRHAARV